MRFLWFMWIWICGTIGSWAVSIGVYLLIYGSDPIHFVEPALNILNVWLLAIPFLTGWQAYRGTTDELFRYR